MTFDELIHCDSIGKGPTRWDFGQLIPKRRESIIRHSKVGQAKKIATFLANVLISELALLVTTYFYKVCSCTEQEWIKLQMISQIFFEYLKHGIKK